MRYLGSLQLLSMLSEFVQLGAVMFDSRCMGLVWALASMFLALVICSEGADAQVARPLDREKIRRDFDDLQRKGSAFLIVHTTQPGLVYIAGIEKSTGEYKLLPARFVQMLEAASNLPNPQEAAPQFEAYQFVLRNYPYCRVCALGLKNFAHFLMNSNPDDESSFYEPTRSSVPGELRRSYIKSVRPAVDTFPIAEKGPFFTQAKAAFGDVDEFLDNTLILHSCYNLPNGDEDVVCRSFWYRKPSDSFTSAIKSLNGQGDQGIVGYLQNLVYMPQGPYTIAMADQLIDMEHHGVEVDGKVWLDVYSKLESEKRERMERGQAVLRAKELQDRATKLKGHYVCKQEDNLLPDGLTCYVPGTGHYDPPVAGCGFTVQGCVDHSTPGVTYKATYIPTIPPTLLPSCTNALTGISPDNLTLYQKQYCTCLDTGYSPYLSRDEKSVLASDFAPYDYDALLRDIALFDQQIAKGKPESFVGPGKACRSIGDTR